MRMHLRVAVALGAVTGLVVAVAAPALANSPEAKIRQEPPAPIQVVDDEDEDSDPRGRDLTWTDNTRPSLTNSFTRSGLTRPGQTDVTRDWTRSVDFTRDLTNTNTNTNTWTNTRGR